MNREKPVQTVSSTRTKAMVSVVQALSKRKDVDTGKNAMDKRNDQISYLQFLANCTHEEALTIISKYPSETNMKFEEISYDFLTEIFPEKRAKKLYENIKGRIIRLLSVD